MMKVYEVERVKNGPRKYRA